MMSEKSIDSLNQLLQGEYMAINAFDIYTPQLKNNDYKKCFQSVQNNHRENISNLAVYIQNIKGQPQENLSFKGSFATMMMQTTVSLKAMNDKEILKKIIEGEEKGIQAAEKVLRGNLDNKSRDMAGEILHQDRKSLSELKSLM